MNVNFNYDRRNTVKSSSGQKKTLEFQGLSCQGVGNLSSYHRKAMNSKWKDTTESINDILDSIKSIKGERVAITAKILLGLKQISILTGLFYQEIEDSEDKESVLHLGKAYQELISLLVEVIGRQVCDLSGEDQPSLVEILPQLQDIINRMAEVDHGYENRNSH